MAADCNIMLNDFDNNIPEDNGRGYGLGIWAGDNIYPNSINMEICFFNDYTGNMCKI